MNKELEMPKTSTLRGLSGEWSWTECTKPFRADVEWELAVPPTRMPGFQFMGGGGPMGWVAYPCHRWHWQMWGIVSNNTVLHSGEYYSHPETGEKYWTYFGSPDGAKVTDAAASPYVAAAQAYGFVFASVSAPADPVDPIVVDEDIPEIPGVDDFVDDELPPGPPSPGVVAKAGIPWWGILLGAGALVTVILVKFGKGR